MSTTFFNNGYGIVDIFSRRIRNCQADLFQSVLSLLYVNCVPRQFKMLDSATFQRHKSITKQIGIKLLDIIFSRMMNNNAIILHVFFQQIGVYNRLPKK